MCPHLCSLAILCKSALHTCALLPYPIPLGAPLPVHRLVAGRARPLSITSTLLACLLSQTVNGTVGQRSSSHEIMSSDLEWRPSVRRLWRAVIPSRDRHNSTQRPCLLCGHVCDSELPRAWHATKRACAASRAMTGECCEEVVNDLLPEELVQSEPRLLWQIPSEDFVYTVDVSGDMRYCAFGGVSKVVHVLDGRTGRPLFKIPTAATVSYTHLRAHETLMNL
eukprot:4118717-Prymnesium_polylepis.1